MVMSPAIVSGLKEISRVQITYIIQFVIDANWGRINIKLLSIIKCKCFISMDVESQTIQGDSMMFG